MVFKIEIAGQKRPPESQTLLWVWLNHVLSSVRITKLQNCLILEFRGQHHYQRCPNRQIMNEQKSDPSLC